MDDKPKNKRISVSVRVIVIAGILLVLAACFSMCFIFIDELPRYSYSINVPDPGDPESGDSVYVMLEIANPLFSKTDTVTLLIADKQVDINSIGDAYGNPLGAPILEDPYLYVKTGRNSKTYIAYTVSLATAGKHGDRGGINENYAVFDGEQALLLPEHYYTYLPDTNQREIMGELSLVYNYPEGWEHINPHPSLKKPRWADIYSIAQDAFVFGHFELLPDTTEGLNAYVPIGSSYDAETLRETVNGFNSLHNYYNTLFEVSPESYKVVWLPRADVDAGTPQVIGGAGTGSVAASFDPESLRDWQLLSHRMFHAFFDNATPQASFHMPGNTWFYEGLATYYENMSMDALPETKKAAIGVNVNLQFTLLFDQYLYMRIKNPALLGFPPMREDELVSSAAIEFLHYTAAPMHVKYLEETAVKSGRKPDDMLKYLVQNSASFDERFVAFEAAIAMLGQATAQEFCETYFLDVNVPPLWDLKDYQPSDEDVLRELNSIEEVIGSWAKQTDPSYYIDTVTYEQLLGTMETIEERRALFLSVDMSQQLEDFCPALYSLLNDYYYHAKELGISYDDPELRTKIFAEEAEAEADL